MKWRIMLALALVPVLALTGSAGIFGKKVKPNPAERVPELLNILKTDGDENKRMEAAEELRQYDPVAFPQMVPVLVEKLSNDPKPAVRAEAAQTLGKIRPVSPAVKSALEQARDKDPSMRVRLQARHSLLGLLWSWGGHGNQPAEPPIQTKEPPLADPKEPALPVIRTQHPPAGAGRGPLLPSPEPPAPPVSVGPQYPRLVPAPLAPPSRLQPMPSGPTAPGSLPQPPPAPPASPSSEPKPILSSPPSQEPAGPELGPQD